jgi:hypothetical protein
MMANGIQRKTNHRDTGNTEKNAEVSFNCFSFILDNLIESFMPEAKVGNSLILNRVQVYPQSRAPVLRLFGSAVLRLLVIL